MILSFGEHSLRLRAYPTRKALADALAECGGRTVLLGDAAQYAEEFYAVTVFPRGHVEGRFAVGVCSETPGIAPCLVLKPATGLLIFGYNSEIAGVAVPGGEVGFRLPCEWLVSQFVDLPRHGMVLAFYDTGVLAVSDDGRKLWSLSTDIIVNWSVTDGCLRLELLETAPVEVDLATGSVASAGRNSV